MLLSLKFWISLPFLTRSPAMQRQSPLSEASPPTMPGGALFSRVEGLEDESWSEVEKERENPRVRSRPLFDHGAMEISPPASSEIFDSLVEDSDTEHPTLIHHPQPHLSPFITLPRHPAFVDYMPLITYQDEMRSTSPGSRNAPSPTLSLVPTEIASRPPSPKPHSCIAQAEDLGIKVRDFAYESHSVPLARPVPDIDQLQARYILYRTAGLSPPPEVVAKLSDLDEEWLTEHARRFDDQANLIKPKSGNMIPWRRPEGKKWRGFGNEELVPVSDGSSVGNATESLELSSDALSGTAPRADEGF